MRRALFLILLLAGCSEPAGPPADLTGSWAEPISIPGAGFGFTLTQVGDSVSGAGMYFIEAGAHGALTVRGRYQRPDVQLEIAREGFSPLEFVGQVAGSRMTGTVTDTLGQSSGMTLVRQ